MSQIVTDLGARHKHKSRINQKNFGKGAGLAGRLRTVREYAACWLGYQCGRAIITGKAENRLAARSNDSSRTVERFEQCLALVGYLAGLTDQGPRAIRLDCNEIGRWRSLAESNRSLHRERDQKPSFYVYGCSE